MVDLGPRAWLSEVVNMNASAMWDGVEMTDRAVELVLAMPTLHLKKTCFWSENDYRYSAKTDSDEKDF